MTIDIESNKDELADQLTKLSPLYFGQALRVIETAQPTPQGDLVGETFCNQRYRFSILPGSTPPIIVYARRMSAKKRVVERA